MSYNRLIKDIVKLSGSEAASQLVLLVALPILTRLYQPEHFGLLGIFVAYSAIGTILAAGRYELAIAIPAKEDEANTLLWLALIISGIAGVLMFVIYLNLPAFSLGILALFVPIHSVVNTWNNSFKIWFARKSYFSLMAVSRLSSSLTVIGVQILCGVYGFVLYGLVWGLMCGAALHLIIALYVFIFKHSIKIPSISHLKNVAKLHGKFPKLTLPGHALNNLATQLPVLVTSYLFGATVGGFFSMCQRLLDAPSAFIGHAIYQVFYPNAAREFNERGSCIEIMSVTARYALLVSVLGFGIVILFGESLIPFLLGEDWRQVGSMCRILSVAYIIQFVHYPLGGTLLIAGKQMIDLAWQFVYVLLVFIGLGLGYVTGNWETSLLGLTIALFLAFSINIWLCFYVAKTSTLQLVEG